MRIYGMQTNRLVNPLGFSLDKLRLSYKVMGEGAQRAARIRVYQGEDTVYDSGLKADIDSLCFEPDMTLAPRTRYDWDVLVETDEGQTCLSPRAWFETGKMGEPWAGRWIAADGNVTNTLLVKDFTLPGQPVSARLYICGLGLYEAYLNGRKVGEEYLAPGCNDYDAWLQYQTYDVTDMLEKDMTLSVLLGDGWYKGRFGFQGQKEIYGDTQALLCELRVKDADGTERVIPSDLSWRAEESPVRFSNIYDGETFDASFAAQMRLPVREAPLGFDRLHERLSPPVLVMETLCPIAILHTKRGETVVDMGQVMTGFLTFRDRGEKGHAYHLRYGEVLQDDCFYTGNLRTAKQEFTYTSDGRETWARPHFTFYGFRYVLLEGFEQEPDINDFVGCVLYSQMAQTGFVKTSDDKVNQLARNTLWGQRGNFLDVPTDCPQRDERMGWTGDAQAFCATACYQMDSAAFFTKFLYDMKMEQLKRGGGVPHVIPSFHMTGSPSCAWADAAAIIPWTLYLFYGDKAMLESQYENMTRWADWIYETDQKMGGRRLWQAGFHFADWLALDADYPASCTGGTDPDFIASAFYLYSTRLTAKAAHALKKQADEKKYAARAEEILAAIRDEYMTKAGHLAVSTQTAYVLALYLGLVPEQEIPHVRAQLDKKLENARGELRTGFVGTAYLNRALTENNMAHRAYSLFLNENYPGWLYEVNMGATTVWERWNSILPDGRISDTGMNSLNHYAYGAIMEWFCRDAVGISPVEDAPGFRRARLAPHPDARLQKASFRYESAVGTYQSAWEVTGEKELSWEVEIPFGGEGEVLLPLCRAEGDAALEEQDGHMTARLKPGKYVFRLTFERAPWAPLPQDVPFAELMKDEAFARLILNAAPHIGDVFKTKPAEKLTLRGLNGYPFSPLPPQELKALQTALAKESFA